MYAFGIKLEWNRSETGLAAWKATLHSVILKKACKVSWIHFISIMITSITFCKSNTFWLRDFIESFKFRLRCPFNSLGGIRSVLRSNIIYDVLSCDLTKARSHQIWCFKLIGSHWNWIGSSPAEMSRCLSHIVAIWQCWTVNIAMWLNW